MKQQMMFLVVHVFSIIALAGCATGVRLESRAIDEMEMLEGRYTVILYGGKQADDLETVAILDREGDDYEMRIFGADFNYSMERNQIGIQALQNGTKFIKKHRLFSHLEQREIFAPDGQLVGYELHPFYQKLNLGVSDAVVVLYSLQEDNMVEVAVRLTAEAEKALESQNR